jgi:hypothetical protein
VFAAMLDKAARISEANFENIFRWDGNALRLVATHNSPPAFTEHRRRVPFRPNQGNPIGDMLKANAARRHFSGQIMGADGDTSRSCRRRRA